LGGDRNTRCTMYAMGPEAHLRRRYRTRSRRSGSSYPDLGMVWAIAAFLAGIQAVCFGEVKNNGQAWRTVLEAVQDGTHYIDEAGLYVLLNRVSKARKGPKIVSWNELTDNPDWHRGRWVKMSARFAESKMALLTNKRRWNKPVYVSLLLDEKTKNAVSFVGIDGSAFRRGARVWVEGYFFKLRSDRPRVRAGSGPVSELIVPVVVGKALRARNPWGEGPHGPDLLTVSLGLVGVLLLLYLYVRRATKPTPERERPRRREWKGETDPELHVPIDLDSFEPSDLGSGGPRSNGDER